MMAIGSGFVDKGGAILLYRSSDLRKWTYMHPLIEGRPSFESAVNPVDNGNMWECPDFFPLGGKHVLLISTRDWFCGRWAHTKNIGSTSRKKEWSITAPTMRRAPNWLAMVNASCGAGFLKNALRTNIAPQVGPDQWLCPACYGSTTTAPLP